ncbi:MAG: hypothetical protein NC236_00350 [Mycoplasma sp.]|nr:hypothetical protein [Mycoplasma sp.]
MKKIFMLVFVILFFIFWLPLKFLSFFICWRKAFFLGEPGLGDIVIQMNYISNINKKVDFWVSKKYYEIIKKITSENNYVTVYSYEDSWKWYTPFIKFYRIIYIPPYMNAFKNLFMSIKILFFTFKIKNIISISANDEKINFLEIFFFFIYKIISFNFTKTFKLNNDNMKDVLKLFWDKRFKSYDKSLSINIKNLFKNKRFENYSVINLFGSENQRVLNSELISHFIKKVGPNEKIIFVGIKKTNDEKIIKLMNSENIINLIGKTNIVELFEIVKYANFVLTVETSIVHISNIFSTKCLTWIPKIKIINYKIPIIKYIKTSNSRNAFLQFSNMYRNDQNSTIKYINLKYLVNEKEKYEFNNNHKEIISDFIKHK